MKANEIKELPEKYYKQVYGENYNSSWKLNKSGLNDDEVRAVSGILKEFNFEELYWVPEVNYPKGVKTPDLFTGIQKIEIKRASSANSVQDQVKRTKGKVDENGILLLEAHNSPLSKEEFMAQAVRHIKHAKVGGVLVVGQFGSDSYFLDKEKRDTFFLRHHSVGNEGASLSDSIIAKNDKKVNTTTLRQKSAKYWRERSLARYSQAEKLAQPYLDALRQEYHASANRAIAEVKKIYLKNGIDREKLAQIVPNGQLSKFLKEVRSLGVELPQNYAWRVNREEFLQAQLWLELQKMGVFEKKNNSQLFEKIIQNAHGEIMNGVGVSFSQLPTATIHNMLNAKFYAKDFKERVNLRTDKQFEILKNRLTMGVAKGESVDKMARDIQERFEISRRSAERLVRTEVNRFENMTEIETWVSLGVKKFEFLASLDGRTSEICRECHGKILTLKNIKAGEYVPPLHPNCRSLLLPVIEDEEMDSSVGIDQAPNMAPAVPIIPDMPAKNEAEPPKRKTGEVKDTLPTDYFERMEYSPREFNSTVRDNGIVDYSKLPQNHPDYLRPHEQKLYEKLVKRYGDVLRIPKDKDAPTNDFVVCGVEWEAKSPENFKYKNIAAHIRPAVKQGKENFIIDMGDRTVTDKMVKQMGLYNSRNPEKQVKRLVIWGKGDPIEIVGKIGR